MEKEAKKCKKSKKCVFKLLEIHFVSLCVCFINIYVFIFYRNVFVFVLLLQGVVGRGSAIYRYARIICIKLEMISM